MQQVYTRFEELRMRDEETIVQFNTQVKKLKNKVAILGEPFPADKLVRKILQSLLSRLRMKVTLIQESTDWEKKSGRKSGILEKNVDILKSQLVENEKELSESSSRAIQLTVDLDSLKKQIHMMSTTSTLDEILNAGRSPNI